MWNQLQFGEELSGGEVARESHVGRVGKPNEPRSFPKSWRQWPWLLRVERKDQESSKETDYQNWRSKCGNQVIELEVIT